MTRARGTGRCWQRVYRSKGELVTAKTWRFRYYDRRAHAYRDESGFKTETAAEKALRKRLSDLDAGKSGGGERTTFKDLQDLIENDYRINGRDTLKKVEQCFKHLKKGLGHLLAVDITEAKVAAYTRKRLDAGASTGTVNRELAALKRAFKLGERAQVVGRVPFIKLMREDNVRQGFFEDHQYRAVLGHLPAYLKPVLSVAYITGWRVGSEILTRQWRHVDLDKRWMRLEPGEAKNEKGRGFPLNGDLLAVLQAQRDALDTFEGEHKRIVPWVFHHDGRRIKAFVRAWATACRKAGVPGGLKHDLRRTAARNMDRAGVPQRVIMELLGMRTPGIFFRYGIVSQADLVEQVAKLPTVAISVKECS